MTFEERTDHVHQSSGAYEEEEVHLRRRRRRRLKSKKDEKGLLKQAKEACKYVKKGDRDLCIDDVMTTGDVEMAEMWPKSLPQHFD